MNTETILITSKDELDMWQQALTNTWRKTLLKNTSIHIEPKSDNRWEMIIEPTSANYLIQLGIEFNELYNMYHKKKK